MHKSWAMTMTGLAMPLIVVATLTGCSSGTSSDSLESPPSQPAASTSTTATPVSTPATDGETGQPAVATPGSYVTWDEFEASGSMSSSSNVVLFFNASWCSTCKAARDNFAATLDQIPSDMTIVVVDYDNSTELKRRHEVTLQHTFVLIDANGDALKKWSGSTTFEQIVDEAA